MLYLKSFKNRSIRLSQPVEVYRNLHRDAFSVRQGGTVVAHGNGLLIFNARTKVLESGRKRVLREGRKNVHATINGRGPLLIDLSSISLVELYYNPYELNSFINRESGEPIKTAEAVYFLDGKAWLIKTK